MRQMNPMTGYLSCNEPIVHFGLGEHATVDELTIDWPSGFRQVLRDVKADQLLVVCEPESGEPELVETKPITTFFQPSDALATVAHVERTYDDFVRQPLLPNKLSQLGPGMAWGDVDHDGDLDLFVGGAAGAAGKLAINQGQGRFELFHGEPFAADAQCEDMGVLFADFDDHFRIERRMHGSIDIRLSAGTQTADDPVFANHRGQCLVFREGKYCINRCGVLREPQVVLVRGRRFAASTTIVRFQQQQFTQQLCALGAVGRAKVLVDVWLLSLLPRELEFQADVVDSLKQRQRKRFVEGIQVVAHTGSSLFHFTHGKGSGVILIPLVSTLLG